MNKKNSIITINGRSYSADTGLLLNMPPAPLTLTHAKPVIPVVAKVSRQPAKSATRHSPHPSHTLMRHAVKKPAAAKRHLKAQGHTDALAPQPYSQVALKPSARQLDHTRLRKARRIPQHKLVSHFSAAVFSGDGHAMLVQARPHAAPPPKTVHHAHPHHTSRSTADMLDQALRHAVSHTETYHAPAHPKLSRRRMKVGGAVLSIAVVGLFVLHSVPTIRLHLASATAGFTATMPDYQPAGYRLGQLDYRTGEVAVKFNSNSDSRSYAITERRSPWDNQTLLDKFVAPADQAYETVSAAGRTVYLYGERNATWIDDGIWYHVQTDNALSSNQLVQLASSM